MDLLLIGGTRFSGRALASLALQRGHRVTLFHRGRTGADWLTSGDRVATHVLGDRNEALEALEGRSFDAVIDFCGFFPRSVRASARALSGSGFYAFISSISAHSSPMRPGGDEDAPLHSPPFPETETLTPESYGPLKRACELEVEAAFPGRFAVIRPGFIVGPDDPTDRLPSLLRRAARGGEMLLPGPPPGKLQFIDARDLAAFCLHLAEGQISGHFNAVHPRGTATLASVVEAARRARSAQTRFVWADPRWLAAQLKAEPDAFPLWDPDDEAIHDLSSERASAAGCRHRPVEETVRDTLDWLDTLGEANERPKSGLSAERESELLALLAGTTAA